MAHRFGRPCRGLVRVAGGARIRNLIFVRHRGRNERERMRAHVDVRNRHFDFWHMAGHALASGRTIFVVGVLSDRRSPGAVPRIRAVTIQTDLIRRLS